MTAIEILEEVFKAKYPNGTFAFISEVQGDKNERYRDKAVTTPYCLLTPDLSDDFTAENGQFTDRFNFRMLLLESNTDQWKTKVDKENNIVAPLRIAAQEILTQVIYKYPESITTDSPFNAQGTPLYDWGSGNHSGIGYRFSVNQMNELNICSAPITYSVDLSSGVGGIATSSLGGEGSYTVDKGDNEAFYAASDSGYRFLRWLLNGGGNETNPISIIFQRAYTIVAEFIAQFTLTTSVSGNGTISPLGANIYDDGDIVDLTVTPDPTYEIDRVEEDGTPISAPYQVLMDASKAVIAYFVAILGIIQDVFGTTPTTELGLHYWPDASISDNKVQIKNIQFAYFDGLSYISGNFTGYSISSYEGVGIPIKTNDSRIDVSIGNIYSITITNGSLTLTWYAQEGWKTSLNFIDQLGNKLIGTITGATLSDFWNTKNELAYPALAAFGGSKVIVNTVAGSAATLADPNGENVGVEKLINGSFNTNTDDWAAFKGGVKSWVAGGYARVDSDDIQANGGIEQAITTTANTWYQVKFKHVDSLNGLIRSDARSGAAIGGIQLAESGDVGIGDHTYYFNSGIHTTVYISIFMRGATVIDNYLITDNITVKEVTTIPAYGDIRFSQKTTMANQPSTYIFANGIEYNATLNCYEIRKDVNDRIRLYQILNGAFVLLFITDLNYVDSTNNIYQYSFQRNEIENQYFTGAINSIRVLIKGGLFLDWTVVDVTGGSGSNPIINSAISVAQFLVLDNDIGDEITQLSKDGVRYYRDFINGTGTYKNRYAIGVGGGIDSDGNAQEYPVNTVWNNGNSYDGIQIAGLETDATFEDVLAIEDSATVTITKDTDLKYISKLQVIG